MGPLGQRVFARQSATQVLISGLAGSVDLGIALATADAAGALLVGLVPRGDQQWAPCRDHAEGKSAAKFQSTSRGSAG